MFSDVREREQRDTGRDREQVSGHERTHPHEGRRDLHEPQRLRIHRALRGSEAAGISGVKLRRNFASAVSLTKDCVIMMIVFQTSFSYLFFTGCLGRKGELWDYLMS